MGNKLILCIEDRPGDVRLIEQSLLKLNERYADNPIKMDVIMDGKEAYEHLCQLNEEEKMPCVILLNLNLPGMPGSELLTEIRNMPKFDKIPIVIHTNGYMPNYPDIYVKAANAFMHKPLDFDECIEAYIKTIDYWMNWHPKYC